MAEKIIADVLDTALARHYEQLGDAEREKQAVVFMDGRWVAIRGDFTPDEIREAVEYIHRYRVSKKLQKSLEDISPFVVDNGEVFIKDAFISETIHAAETLKPKNSNSNIDVGKILDDAWKSGRPCIGEAVNNLAQVIASARVSSQIFKQHTSCGEITPLTYTASMSINVNDAPSASGADSNIDGISFEVSDKDMVVNLAGGGRIVISNWGDSSTMVSKALPPLAHTASLGLSCHDIAKETLSAVLAATLPNVPRGRTEEAAIALARAVRSAFNALGNDNASPR
ncbi:TPA: hypothetical protein ACIIU4_004373 [Citrobacter freundii]|uniref:hypothetical protein n=1 Tax=Citrobacter freundii TaxID=546 RepID=UPI0008FD37F9|nr:hypothetical protein [Citrobacter freundii]MDU1753083.1 hypothetical protein [Citrobacter sp.]MDU4810183.1 hypothetical protein [Citrobacter freundii]OIZ38341.1 hypothetical protein BEH71_20640 [Citrobacter freundii]HAU5643764.1 hypothetical protein [Citrobacter freundii]